VPVVIKSLIFPASTAVGKDWQAAAGAAAAKIAAASPSS
jgi:hypothetical protein